MDAATLTSWIKNLGNPHERLVAAGVIPDQPLTELYKGRDWLTLNVGEGVELSFLAENKVLETIYITLIHTVEGQTVFQGELPKPFELRMDQARVRENFGSPIESKGPMRLPNLPPMGGIDTYSIDVQTHSSARVIFQYTADLKVDTLIFTLNDY